jgi:hypothetical protein
VRLRFEVCEKERECVCEGEDEGEEVKCVYM